MESNVRAWQGGLEPRESCRYNESDTQNWSTHGLNINKQTYYTTYPVTSPDKLTYYPNHTHVLSRDMTSCDPSLNTNTQIGSMTTMTSSHMRYKPPQHFSSGPTAEMEHWHLQMLSQTDPFSALPLREGASKQKRRRVISHEQRSAANIRERRRMYQLNDAFDGLRKRVPTFAYEKTLSRIETLKLAVTYIEFMAEILENNGKKCEDLVNKAKSNQGDNTRSLVTDDDSLIIPDNDVTSASHSSNQSTGERQSCDVPDEDRNID